jgi:hypothetical protein
VCAAAVFAAAVPAYGQALGDLAKQEEARRAVATKSVRTLSNADLKPSEIAPPAGAATEPATAPSCWMSRLKGRCVSADEMLSNSVAGVLTKENAPFEQKWRDYAAAIRMPLEQTQSLIATLEDVVADESRSPGERKVAEQALAAARKTLARYEQQWETLETVAGNQYLPRKWLEPIPTISSRIPQ